MKKSTKKKYDAFKADGSAYAELAGEFEREEMPDYSFKSNAQAMGKNAKKLRRNKVLRTVLSVFGAVLVLYFGYFVIAVIKGVNSRSQDPTAQAVEIIEKEITTVPQTEQSTAVPQSTTEQQDAMLNETTQAQSTTEQDAEANDMIETEESDS